MLMVGNWRLDNVSNYEASVDVDFDDAELDDMSGGTLQEKRHAGYRPRVKLVEDSPYADTYITDGKAGLCLLRPC